MIVITGNYGQLCNRLIVFAHFVAAAREHALHVADPALGEYAEYFDATCRDVLCRYPKCTRRPLLRGNRLRLLAHGLATRSARYVRKFHNRTHHWPAGVRTLDIGWFDRCDLDSAEFLSAARSSRLLLAKGWQFRAHSSFTRHADAVRALFTPRVALAASIEQHLTALRQRARTLIGVHIRHGDYRTFEDGRFFFPAADYAAQMRHACALFDRHETLFVICSNEPQPAHVFDGLNIAYGPGQPLADLYTLAGCDYLIGPPSTYGQWASFYGRVPRHVMTSANQPLSLGEFAIERDFASALPAPPIHAVA